MPWKTAWSDTLSAVASGQYNYLNRDLYPNAALSFTGSKIRVTLAAKASGSYKIAEMYVGHKAGSGDAYDFDGNQVRITFDSGNNGATVAEGVDKVSDEITFAFDGTKDLLVSYYGNDAAYDDWPTKAIAGITEYYKSGGLTDVGTTNISGMNSASNVMMLLNKIEVFDETDVTVVAEPLAAAAGLSSVPAQQIAAGALAAKATFGVADVYRGRTIAADPLTAGAVLAAKIDMDVVADALAAEAALSATVQAVIPAPPLPATASLSVKDAMVGAFVAAEPFAAQGRISASLRMLLGSPAVAGQAALTGGLAVVLPADSLAAATRLASGGVVCFVDRDYKITYVCYFGDLLVPITSFQARFKSGDPSFLSVVVPGLDLAEAIAARAGEALRVYMVKTYSNGNTARELLGEVDNDDIRTDEGSENQSITIDGHKTTTHTPKTVTLAGPQYRSYYGGGLRYRCSPDYYLRPGDTVSIGEDTFQANVISWAVSVDQQLMEVSEL